MINGLHYRVLGIHKSQKKILVVTNSNYFSIIWIYDSFRRRYGSNSIYLCNILVFCSVFIKLTLLNN